jgi:hypothetical protein
MTCSMRKMSNTPAQAGCREFLSYERNFTSHLGVVPVFAENCGLCLRYDSGGRQLRLLQVAPRGPGGRDSSEQTTTSGKIRAVEIDPPIGTPDCRKASPNRTRLARPMPGGVPRSYRQPVRSTSVTRITRRLEKIRDPWDDFQASRARDAVYGYLAAVFELVMHYKVRRKTKTLLRHAFKFAELPFDRNADPFSAVIRCTSDDHADSKAISKWARALRYVARCKERGTPLKVFMKEAGGVNACASLYARRGKRDNRRSPRDRTNQLAC